MEIFFYFSNLIFLWEKFFTMNIKKLIVLSLSILFTGVCSAQAPVVKDADNAFRTCKYEKALQEYKKVTSKIKKNKVESRRVAYQIAECYRIMC